MNNDMLNSVQEIKTVRMEVIPKTIPAVSGKKHRPGESKIVYVLGGGLLNKKYGVDIQN